MEGENQHHTEWFELAQRITELRAQMDLNVRAGLYETAARLRDERYALEQKLQSCGNPTLLRNIEIANSHSWSVIAKRLEPQETTVDQPLLRRLEDARLPVRWIIEKLSEAPVGTLRRRLNVESLESPYFRALFPVISPATIPASADMQVWIDVLINETSNAKTPIIWICTDLNWLAPTGVFERWREIFQRPDFEFVACVEDLGSPRTKQVIGFSNVTIVRA